jgi:hypothetical protein
LLDEFSTVTPNAGEGVLIGHRRIDWQKSDVI